jgi:hypothetical protein
MGRRQAGGGGGKEGGLNLESRKTTMQKGQILFLGLTSQNA